MAAMADIFNALLSGPYAPWLPLFVLMILLGTAIWDARTGIVPNIPLLIGTVAIIAGWYFESGWREALTYLCMGLGACAIIWVINEIWYRLFKKDAIGMGDAKWTGLAVATFGVFPGAAAWLAGSWVSILWIGFCYLIGKRIRKVYFAPFLFCGLILGLLAARKIIVLPYPFAF
jgi:prepilin signal peptidase PulO-like enzyme (type II secretory pathway)